jgi:hypothetical protein
MYYSIFDRDTGTYMATGRNSKTKEEAAMDLYGYLDGGGSFDFDESDGQSWKEEAENDPDEFANGFNFEIMEHEELMPDNE